MTKTIQIDEVSGIKFYYDMRNHIWIYKISIRRLI